MRKTKRETALILTLVLCLISVLAIPSHGFAKVALNKKNLTLQVGKTYALKLKGTRKKVTWKSNKKAVASVSGRGVVKANKAGIATITAKSGKKKYKCKVTVKGTSPAKNPAGVSADTGVHPTSVPSIPIAVPTAVPTNAPISNNILAANMGVVTQVVKHSGVLFRITNNNSIQVENYTINYQLKDSSGLVIETGYESGYAINPGETHLRCGYLTSEEISKVDVSKSTISVTVDNYYNYEDAKNYVTVTAGQSSDGLSIPLTISNTSSTKPVSVGDVIVLFYDSGNQVIGFGREWAYLSYGETKFTEVSIPWGYVNDDYTVINYARMEVYTYANS